ncbi:MAG: hypothetical protein OXU37_04640 [Thaumarchaeota archaeon]|nr:hypothetical protein [Nitrososphaerota archaeon]
MVAEAVVQEEAFLSLGLEHRIMLCTEVTALAGDHATAPEADESVLAGVPVPEDSLIPVSDVTSETHPAEDGADGGVPETTVKLTCRNPRIHDAVARCYERDRETQRQKVRVWVLRATDSYGDTLDYRFRARLAGAVSFGKGDEHDVVGVFLTPLDRRPTITKV